MARREAAGAAALRDVRLCFCFRVPQSALGVWSFQRCPATIGHHGGGPSEDFLEIVEQFRLRLQWRLEATREVRDTVGSGKAEPVGELGQSRLRVAAAQPGCDRSRHVRVVTLKVDHAQCSNRGDGPTPVS